MKPILVSKCRNKFLNFLGHIRSNWNDLLVRIYIFVLVFDWEVWFLRARTIFHFNDDIHWKWNS